MLSNKLYDVLKWVTMIALPALGALYFALSSIWGFPYGEQIVGTLSAITVFLGALIGISSAQYNKIEVPNRPASDINTDIVSHEIQGADVVSVSDEEVG